MKIVWEINGRNVYLGEIIENKFYTTRTRKHIFRILNAFGFNYALLKSLKEIGIEKVVIDFEGKIYEIELKRLLRDGIYKKVNSEEQIFIKLEDIEKWRKN